MFERTHFHHLLIAGLVVFLGFVLTAAQQAQTPSSPQPKKSQEIKEGEAMIRERTEVVSLTVTVTDPYDRLVTGLDRQHFEVFEDKVRQSIESILLAGCQI